MDVLSLFKFLETINKIGNMRLITVLAEKIRGPSSIPQKVRWEPSHGTQPGIMTWDESGATIGPERFIPWSELQDELHRRLLPHMFADPSGFRFAVEDHHGKRNWVVKVLDGAGKGYCYLWFGVNPDKGWEFDGFVRLGGNKPPHVWQSYQRYSNGTYRRLQSAYSTLEAVRSQCGV